MKKQSDTSEKKRDADGLHRRRGIWEFSLRINGKRRSFSAGTRVFKEAKEFKREKEQEQKQGQIPKDAARKPFKQVLVAVLAVRKPHLAENSMKLEAARGRQLAKHFGDRRVADIGIEEIRVYQ
jgi:hypothetical protein